VALELKRKRGLNPLVLNMASSRRPGGGYKTGAGAQEGMSLSISSRLILKHPSIRKSIQVCCQRLAIALYNSTPVGLSQSYIQNLGEAIIINPWKTQNG